MSYSPNELAELVCPKAFLKIKGYISLDKALGISVEWKMSFFSLWLWLHTLKAFFNSKEKS